MISMLFEVTASVFAYGSREAEVHINDVRPQKKTVFITGATGVMGSATIKEMMKNMTDLHIKALVLDTPKERKKLEQIPTHPDFEVIWGDFLDYDTVYNAIQGCNYVLHIGGLVSPFADNKPYETERVNVGGAKVISQAVLAQPNADEIKVCYIGSVAETGDRNYPIHWGRTGDPIKVSIYDHYAISKVIAERIFVESGIKNWVVFRQSGILHPGIMHHLEPIAFHVPLNGVLEWSTVEDSARLMNNFVRADNLPESFWCKYYNIGSGEKYRLTNYQFETYLLGALGMGPVEELFEPNWFVTKNFHGHFYADSDILENYLHFRANAPILEYFDYLAQQCEFYFRIPRLIPCKSLIGAVAKPFMKQIAKTEVFGTLDWIEKSNMNRITAYYGSMEEYNKIGGWDTFEIAEYNTSVAVAPQYRLSHGYDETKPLSELDVNDMKEAAKFRGGECLSKTMKTGDLRTKLLWKCHHCGHEFLASPNLILLGGHWCPHCYVPQKKWDYDSIAKTNDFFAQVWYPNHDVNEHNVYDFDSLFTESVWVK